MVTILAYSFSKRRLVQPQDGLPIRLSGSDKWRKLQFLQHESAARDRGVHGPGLILPWHITWRS